MPRRRRRSPTLDDDRRPARGAGVDDDAAATRSSSSSSATGSWSRTIAGALCGSRRVRRAAGHELHRPRPLPRHLRRVRGQRRCSASTSSLGAGVWGLASALAISGVTRRRDDRRRRGDRRDHDRVVRARPRAVRALRRRGQSFDAALFGSILGVEHARVVASPSSPWSPSRSWCFFALPGAAVHDLRSRGRRRVRRQHRPHRRRC